MEYTVNTNESNVSTTLENPENKEWTIDDLYSQPFSIEEIAQALELVSRFKEKYPNDEFVLGFEEILRDEACHMFGGTLYDYED